MVLALAVGVGGALGAVGRYLVDVLVRRHVGGDWPWGTLAVNVIGSFALGVLVGVAVDQSWATSARAVLGAGVCGGLTTWSTATWETVQLAEQGSPGMAMGYAIGGLAASIAAAAVGLAIGAAVL